MARNSGSISGFQSPKKMCFSSRSLLKKCFLRQSKEICRLKIGDNLVSVVDQSANWSCQLLWVRCFVFCSNLHQVCSTYEVCVNGEGQGQGILYKSFSCFESQGQCINFLQNPDALWSQKKLRILPSLWLNNFNLSFYAGLNICLSCKMSGSECYWLPENRFQIGPQMMRSWEFAFKVLQKLGWRVTAQEQGVSEISTQPRQSQGALIFGMHCSKGIPFLKHWQHFSSFFFPLHQAGTTEKKKKKMWGILKSEMVIDHFGKRNRHWSGCFGFSKCPAVCRGQIPLDNVTYRH
jgi:hypothetical protein